MATDSPHNIQDNSTHFVRRIRAPRSISFVDISETVDPLRSGWQSGIFPTVTRTLVLGQKLGCRALPGIAIPLATFYLLSKGPSALHDVF